MTPRPIIRPQAQSLLFLPLLTHGAQTYIASNDELPLRDNRKENGNYYIILGSYRDNGKENGNYYITTLNPKP